MEKKEQLHEQPQKKLYVKPKLEHYGDVRDLTLAPTPFTQFESGYGFARRRRATENLPPFR